MTAEKNNGRGFLRKKPGNGHSNNFLRQPEDIYYIFIRGFNG